MKKKIRKAGAVILVICLCIGCALVLGGCSPRGKMIGEDKAIELAINHFGLNAADCTVRKVELDEGKYEIEFVCGNKEYDVEINAFSGKVRERDVEYNDDYVGTASRDTTRIPDTTLAPDTTQTPDTTAKAPDGIISAERAKTLAIEHFGLKAENCRFVRADLDGRKYEIEFVCDKKDYEAEIDAYTGQVLETDVESVFD